jgi:hypothetical protein
MRSKQAIERRKRRKELVKVLIEEIDRLDTSPSAIVKVSRAQAQAIIARMFTSAPTAEKRPTRITVSVDALLDSLRSTATKEVIDELYVEIEDFGKMEHDDGYHEGYDRGTEDAEDEED